MRAGGVCISTYVLYASDCSMVVLMREVCICAARKGMGKEEKKITSLWNKLQSNNIRSSTPTSFVHLAKRTCIHGVVLLLREYTNDNIQEELFEKNKKIEYKVQAILAFCFCSNRCAVFDVLQKLTIDKRTHTLTVTHVRARAHTFCWYAIKNVYLL